MVRLIRPPSASKRRRAGIDTVDAMEGKPRAATKDQHVAGIEAKRTGRIAALEPADAEQAGIAERNRDHGSGENGLIAVLVQAHFRCRPVKVDQAGLRRMRIVGNAVPQSQQGFRQRRPWSAGLRMRRRVAIAILVRHPAERAAVRHADGERPARFRHARGKQRRLLQHRAQSREQLPLRAGIEIAGKHQEAGFAGISVFFRQLGHL